MKPVKCRIPTPFPFNDEKRQQKIRQKILKTLKKIKNSLHSTIKNKKKLRI